MGAFTNTFGKVIQGSGLNPIDITWTIPITGQSSGTPTAGTMVITCSEDIAITATGDVTISVAQAADGIYRRHTVTINCPNGGSGTVVIPDRTKVKTLGGYVGTQFTTRFYTGTNTTAPILTWNLNDIPSGVEKVCQTEAYTTILPTTGTTAMPSGLTLLYLNGANISWTYTGALPTGLLSLALYSISGTWTYSGALPTGLTFINNLGSAIVWSHSGALPTGLTYLYFNCANSNWTGLDIGDTGNITTLELRNFRNAKMSSADMITLLTQMTNRTGTLPATVIINDYADYASPPSGVTDAVAALKTAKSITTVTLGA